MPGSSGLSDILNKTLDDLGLFPKARKYQVFSLWNKIVGDIAKYAKPRRIQGDVLFVATASSVWSQELSFMRESILAKINAALGESHIKEVRFSEHLWAAQEDGGTKLGPARASAPPLTVEEATRVKELGGEIADAGLLRAFRKTAGTMLRRRRYLLSSGYKLCTTCGCIYPQEKSECPACKAKREFVAVNRAIAILDRSPEVGNDELSRLSGLEDPYLCERARREVESRLESFVRYRLAAAARDSEVFGVTGGVRALSGGRRRSPEKEAARAEVAAAIRKLASLRYHLPFESISPEDVERAVGRRFATLVKRG